MRRLYTIGHTRKSLREFVGLLREAGVDTVVDIRLRNTSHLAGFAKRDDLEFLLREGFGIGYAHHPELAPTEEMLSRYRADRDWHAYAEGFARLMEERGTPEAAAAILVPLDAPCLLCAEDSPEHCHRRLVAEAVAAHTGWEVIHLQ